MIPFVHPHVPFMPCDEFCARRPEILQEIIDLKQKRSLSLGPDMTVLFEHPQLVWWQIQEMVRIERGTPEQWLEEWEVYRHLLPETNRITVTLTIDIADPIRRKRALRQWIGIEKRISLEGAGYRVMAEPIDVSDVSDVSASERELVHDTKLAMAKPHGEVLQMDKVGEGDERSSRIDINTGLHCDEEDRSIMMAGESKTSAVHFLAFPLTASVIKELMCNAPVVTCGYPQALVRVPVGLELWTMLIKERTS